MPGSPAGFVAAKSIMRSSRVHDFSDKSRDRRIGKVDLVTRVAHGGSTAADAVALRIETLREERHVKSLLLFARDVMHVITELIAVEFDELAAAEQIRPLCPQGIQLQPTSGKSQATPSVLPQPFRYRRHRRAPR